MRRLGYFGALSLVVGNIIGVGIFTTTGYMASYIDSPLLIVMAWIVGALYALSGAVVYGILAKKYPLSGGDYQYLTQAMHPILGYGFGWSAFFVTYSGSIAALAIAAAYYLLGISGGAWEENPALSFSLFGFYSTISAVKLIAVLFIALFSLINYRGIILSGKFQSVLTSAIVFLLLFFIGGGLTTTVPAATDTITGTLSGSGLSGFTMALVAVLFAYMGWTTAVYVAEEVEEPSRILPQVLVTGVLIVAVLYIAVNIVFTSVLSVSEMRGVVNIGSKIGERLWGAEGRSIVSLIILIAVLSSLNSTILSGPRIYMAMGKDGFVHGVTRKIHPRFGVPHIAIVWQGIWSLVLVLTGSFNELLSLVVFVAIMFSILAAIIALKSERTKSSVSVIKLISVWFYMVFCALILINTFVQQPLRSLSGFGLVVLAIPFYFWEVRKKRSN